MKAEVVDREVVYVTPRCRDRHRCARPISPWKPESEPEAPETDDDGAEVTTLTPKVAGTNTSEPRLPRPHGRRIVDGASRAYDSTADCCASASSSSARPSTTRSPTDLRPDALLESEDPDKDINLYINSPGV